MAYSFAGAETPWASQSATFISAFGTPAAEQMANTEAGNIASKINELRGEANALADQALRYINECAAFTASPVTVVYTPPTYAAGQYNKANVGSPPSVTPTAGNANPASIKTINRIDPLVDSHGSFGSLPSTSTEPTDSSLGTIPAAPQDPVVDNITLAPAPSITVNPKPISIPAAPSISTEAPTIGDPMTPKPLKVEVDDADDVQNAIDALRSIASQTATSPPLIWQFPEIFTAIGMMISGNSPLYKTIIEDSITRASAFDDQYTEAVSTIWSRRNMTSYSDNAMPEFVSRETTRMTEQRAVFKRMLEGLWKDDLFKLGLRLGAAAYALAIDMKINMFNIQFDALMGAAEAQLELVKAAEMAYKGTLATLEAEAARLTAEYAVASAKADVFNLTADVQTNKADVNRAIASVFEASESAKTVELQLAEVDKYSDIARLKNYEGRMKEIAASAETAALGLEKFKSRVAKWGADIMAHKVEFEQYKGRASRVKANNNAKVASLSAKEAEYASDVADTAVNAAKASIKAGEELFDIAVRTGALAATEYTNLIAASSDKEALAVYMLQAGAEAARLMSERAELAGITEENQGAAAFFTAAAEAAGRAADLTQASNIQLSEAYATAQEAAGRAAAAVETGRLSGWNASATISASGTLDAAITDALTGSESFSTSITQASNAVSEVGYE